MARVSVQISVYPLRQPHLGPAIERAIDAFRTQGLQISSGTMSTVVSGEPDAIFDALKESFGAAASTGDVVMVAAISNCCPACESGPGDERQRAPATDTRST